MGILGGGKHDEDSDDAALDRMFGGGSGGNICKAKYKVKDKNGKTVTRTCIKKKGHWGKHK